MLIEFISVEGIENSEPNFRKGWQAATRSNRLNDAGAEGGTSGQPVILGSQNAENSHAKSPPMLLSLHLPLFVPPFLRGDLVQPLLFLGGSVISARARSSAIFASRKAVACCHRASLCAANSADRASTSDFAAIAL